MMLKKKHIFIYSKNMNMARRVMKKRSNIVINLIHNKYLKRCNLSLLFKDRYS